jgi:lipoyl(octanoyl) transferase
MSKVDNESLMDTDVLVPTKFTDWGLTDYQEAWDKQEDLLNKTVTVKTENRINSSNLPTPNHLIFANTHTYIR